MADTGNKERSQLDQGLDDAREVEEGETGEETKIKVLTVQMMLNSQTPTAVQERLDGLAETPAGSIESLPRIVKTRVNALKNLHVKCAQTEAKFREEVHDLERKDAGLYQSLFDERFEIINAIYGPMEEREWKPDEENEISEELKEKAKIEDEKKDDEKDDPKGIPEFLVDCF
ncbi:hypothetical protein CB1_000174008 [Camelus ferus]|nr:hypothetical protein CB1_000174008 [Camelus ferus]